MTVIPPLQLYLTPTHTPASSTPMFTSTSTFTPSYTTPTFTPSSILFPPTLPASSISHLHIALTNIISCTMDITHADTIRAMRSSSILKQARCFMSAMQWCGGEAVLPCMHRISATVLCIISNTQCLTVALLLALKIAEHYVPVATPSPPHHHHPQSMVYLRALP